MLGDRTHALSPDLLRALPESIGSDRITGHVRIGAGLDGAFGETHLFWLGAELRACWRPSMFEPLQVVPLRHAEAPVLDASGFDARLRFHTQDGAERTVAISILDADAVTAFLAAAAGQPSTPSGAPPPPDVVAAEPRPAGPGSAPSLPARSGAPAPLGDDLEVPGPPGSVAATGRILVLAAGLVLLLGIAVAMFVR